MKMSTILKCALFMGSIVSGPAVFAEDLQGLVNRYYETGEPALRHYLTKLDPSLSFNPIYVGLGSAKRTLKHGAQALKSVDFAAYLAGAKEYAQDGYKAVSPYVQAYWKPVVAVAGLAAITASTVYAYKKYLANDKK